MNQVLIIQTAFIGDAILASAMLEQIHKAYPSYAIDLLVRKGNESLFEDHPFLRQTLVWDKKKKYASMWRCIQNIRNKRYDFVINAQRFASSGIITALSGAKQTAGYSNNPLSRFFTKRLKHVLGAKEDKQFEHEIERNSALINLLIHVELAQPKLYPSEKDFEIIKTYQTAPYVCIAPASVWFTKQWPESKWKELLESLGSMKVYLLGAPSDAELCERLAFESPFAESLAGKLGLLASAALMKGALMNYTNDSAPMHLASAMNAPTTAIFCSTIPQFGFGPLADERHIWQVESALACRPCGIHGKGACPEGHFKCALDIQIKALSK